MPDSIPPETWSAAKPETLAKPTWWPASLAFAIMLVGWGLITSTIVLAAGAIVLVVSIAGWIGEMSHEHS